jgi:hypothetical protein
VIVEQGSEPSACPLGGNGAARCNRREDRFAGRDEAAR